MDDSTRFNTMPEMQNSLRVDVTSEVIATWAIQNGISNEELDKVIDLENLMVEKKTQYSH